MIKLSFGYLEGNWRGRTPLRPIHFSPTSLMSSAACTASDLSFEAVARLKSSVKASGEFIVIVAAVLSNIQSRPKRGGDARRLRIMLTRSLARHVCYSLLVSIDHTQIGFVVGQVRCSVGQKGH